MFTALKGNEIIATKDAYFGDILVAKKNETFTIENVWFNDKMGTCVVSCEENKKFNFQDTCNYFQDKVELSSRDITEWPVEPEPNE